MAHFDTDVLVIGAGPTGLMAAAELARHGVAHRIVDENPGCVRNSRALTLHARTLEILQILDLTDTLVRRGYPSPGINVAVDTRNPALAGLYTVGTRCTTLAGLPTSRPRTESSTATAPAVSS
jgi:2-polyprenyl-6-methoxyphenol hydroxylase-like FAD-dependent oxidoreductase